MQMHVQNILEMFIGNNMEEKNQKHKQQDLTELNIELTKEEEEQLKKKLEKLRQQDPFIYR